MRFLAPWHPQVNRSLETERQFAQKLGQQAAATKEELKAALNASAELSKRNSALGDDLEVGRAAVHVCGWLVGCRWCCF